MFTYIYPPQSVSVATPPIQFVQDGVDVTVSQDTSNPINNVTLPTLNFIIKDGVQVPVTKDTGVPSNTVGIPVEIVSGSGTEINITAGDINIQTTDMGLNFDSMRIGDGTGNYIKANSNGSIDANILGTVPVSGALTDAQLRATPVPVSGTVSTGLSQPLTDAELRASAVPVSAASLPLPTGAATETTLSSIDTKTPALVGGRVPVDGSGVTQPILAASLPLPTGAATESTLSAVNGKIPATLGQKASSASLATVLSTEQEALLTAIRDGVRASTPNGSSQSNSTVGTTAANVAIPANTVGFIIQGFTGNAGLYWSLAGTAANNGTSGHKLEDSRDSGFIPYAGTGNLSVVGEAAGTRYQITWFTRS